MIPKAVQIDEQEQLPDFEREARPLFSQWDIMERFILGQFAYMIERLAKLELYSKRESQKELGTIPDELIQSDIMPMIAFFQGQCKAIEFEKGAFQLQGLTQIIRRGELTFERLRSEMERLLSDIKWELHTRIFWYVPTNRAKHIDDMLTQPWGAIWEHFPAGARQDAEEAVYCFALERYTASVFHLMRVSEWGLRNIAKRMHVTIRDKGTRCPLEYGDWNKVIVALKNKIDAARALPKGPRKNAKLELYSDAADHCSYMKDIWRNNASHTRKPYQELDALRVLERVKGFMTFVGAL
jgi:hypothetical protein